MILALVLTTISAFLCVYRQLWLRIFGPWPMATGGVNGIHGLCEGRGDGHGPAVDTKQGADGDECGDDQSDLLV